MPTAYLHPRPSVPQPPPPFTRERIAAQRAFFAAHPELAPTPLHRLPALAKRLGIGELLVKDETHRFGLPSFKGLGLRFALDALEQSGQLEGVTTLVCASEGNHGRAVAQAARSSGRAARVYVGARVAAERAAAIEGEGATLVRVHGTYEDAVAAAAAAEGPDTRVISDTGWPGYENIPGHIMVGYTRLMDEAASQWGQAPDIFIVQAGVGALLASAAAWLRWHAPPSGEANGVSASGQMIAAEPASAACVQAALRAGRSCRLQSAPDTDMGGLRCSEVSLPAFGPIQATVDAAVGIEDEWAHTAMRQLARPEAGDPMVFAGTSGAAGLGALAALLQDPALDDARQRLGIGASSCVLVIVSEGVTEPALWHRLMEGRP